MKDIMEKVEKTLVFYEGTDLQKVLNVLARMEIIDDLHGYPNFEIVETATGKVVCKAPSVVGKTYPVIWNILADIWGFTTIDRPEYKDMLFAFEKE